MRLLRREMRVLLRPGLAAAAAAAVGLLLSFVALYQQSAAGQWDLVQSTAAAVEDRIAQCRETRSADRCAAQRERLQTSQRIYATEQQDRFAVAAAMQHPIGAGGVSAGLLASLPGLVVMGGVGALHAAGEWSLGTVRPLLARSRRRPLYVAKVASTWLAGLALLALSWFVVALSGPLFGRAWEVPPAPTGFGAWAYTWPMVAKGLLVFAAMAAVSVAAPVLIRNVLGTFAILLAGLVASLAMTAQPSLLPLSPAYWLAGWMGWERDFLLADHVWVDQFPLGNHNPAIDPTLWAGLLGIVAGAAVALLIGWLRLARTDVGG